ncbi:MAG: hypothetical protein JNN30_20030 [Rhodanobacteraceae bacterium]|nr:hypothetical protein [Rhodanobacteraceae bacterium]
MLRYVLMLAAFSVSTLGADSLGDAAAVSESKSGGATETYSVDGILSYKKETCIGYVTHSRPSGPRRSRAILVESSGSGLEKCNSAVRESSPIFLMEGVETEKAVVAYLMIKKCLANATGCAEVSSRDLVTLNSVISGKRITAFDSGDDGSQSLMLHACPEGRVPWVSKCSSALFKLKDGAVSDLEVVKFLD